MRQLTTLDAEDQWPSWSPDGQKIAFVSNRSGNQDIWVMGADGGNKRQLTTPEVEQWHYQPVWSPDGQKIAFRSLRSGNYDIWVMDADGGRKRQLTTHPPTAPRYMDDAPSWSPDGQKIAFASSRIGNWEIWVMDTDGGYTQQLTTYAGMDDTPVWSPDGQKIAFVSVRSGNHDIWVMDADGGNKRRLTMDEFVEYSPSWSPDAQKIAFASGRTGTWDIWMMDADGGHMRQLTMYDGQDKFPSWSPDGREIAFTSDRSGNPDIWVMDIRGFSPEEEQRTFILNTAIVEFQEKGSLDIKDAGEIVAGWMSSSLIKTGAFTLYERVLLYKILEEQDLGLTGALDEKTTAEIGKLYGVDAIVTGTVSKFGSTISVVVKLIDTETAKVIASSDVKTTSVDAIPGAMDRLARELAREP